MPRLSQYELERQETIRRNQELLKSLGIFEAGTNIAPKKQKPPEKTKSVKKRSRSPGLEQDVTTIQPRRKSARLAASVAGFTAPSDAVLNSDPIDFLSTPPRQRVTLRKTTPSLPPVIEDNDYFNSSYRASLPHRDEDGTLRFELETHFTPNLTPEEVLREGSFGGTAFSSHYSQILKHQLPEKDYLEFPTSWFDGLDVDSYVTSDDYHPSINKYGVKAGQSLQEWEKAGWVHEQDPRGWFQWYCRFYLGRRTRDDYRQIKRWIGICGRNGGARFKRALIKKIAETGSRWDDESVAPILRQTLQHWGYRLTESDYLALIT